MPAQRSQWLAFPDYSSDHFRAQGGVLKCNLTTRMRILLKYIVPQRLVCPVLIPLLTQWNLHLCKFNLARLLQHYCGVILQAAEAVQERPLGLFITFVFSYCSYWGGSVAGAVCRGECSKNQTCQQCWTIFRIKTLRICYRHIVNGHLN